MTVHGIVDKLELSVFCIGNDVEIEGVYCCDLLSNALVKLKKQHVWVTVMNNVNVAAVAYNNNAACVLLSEGITPDRQFMDDATKHGITVLGTDEKTFEIAMKLGKII